MGRRLVTVAVVVALAWCAEGKKKKTKKKSTATAKRAMDGGGAAPKLAELSECAACENWASDATTFVRASVRRRLEPPPEPEAGAPAGLEPTWEMRLNRTCRAPRLPWCENWRVHENRGLIDELKALADDAEDIKDSSIAVISVAQAMCAHDGPIRACGPKHKFKKRPSPHATDVSFANRVKGRAVKVYWLEAGVDITSEKAVARNFRGAIPESGQMSEDSYKGHRYLFVVDGEPWANGVVLTVPEGPFVAFSVERNAKYDPAGVPETVPAKGAKRPRGWDDAEDGPWEPPLVPNPKFAANVPYVVRQATEAEL